MLWAVFNILAICGVSFIVGTWGDDRPTQKKIRVAGAILVAVSLVLLTILLND